MSSSERQSRKRKAQHVSSSSSKQQQEHDDKSCPLTIKMTSLKNQQQCTLIDVPSEDNTFIALIVRNHHYTIELFNHDALDDYSILVSIDNIQLGHQEIVVIPDDSILLHEYFGELVFTKDCHIQVTISKIASLKKKKKQKTDDSFHLLQKASTKEKLISVYCYTPKTFVKKLEEFELSDRQKELTDYERNTLTQSPEDTTDNDEDGSLNGNGTNGSTKTMDTAVIERLQATATDPIYSSLMSTEQHPFHNTYYPQVHDEVAFIRDGYLAFCSNMESSSDLANYLKPVLEHLPPFNIEELPDVLLCEIIDVQYRYAALYHNTIPVTVRTVTLGIKEIQGTSLTKQQLVGTQFELDYFDHPNVCMANYMILRCIYEKAKEFAAKKLKKNMTIHASFDKQFVPGKVVEVSPSEPDKPDSPWEGVLVRWSDDTDSRVSIWELSEIGKPHDLGIPSIDAAKAEKLQKVIVDFSRPEIIQKIPMYTATDVYPLLIETISMRLENNFYRHVDAFIADLIHILTVFTEANHKSEGVRELQKLYAKVEAIVEAGVTANAPSKQPYTPPKLEVKKTNSKKTPKESESDEELDDNLIQLVTKHQSNSLPKPDGRSAPSTSSAPKEAKDEPVGMNSNVPRPDVKQYATPAADNVTISSNSTTSSNANRRKPQITDWSKEDVKSFIKQIFEGTREEYTEYLTLIDTHQINGKLLLQEDNALLSGHNGPALAIALVKYINRNKK
jgi:hypothetical protein